MDQVNQRIAMLESVYTTIDPMTVHRGKIHHYLGLILDFQAEGEVQITMDDYIKKLIDSLPLEDTKGCKHTFTPKHLFETNDEEVIELLKEMRDLFPQDHSTDIMDSSQARKIRPTASNGIPF